MASVVDEWRCQLCLKPNNPEDERCFNCSKNSVWKCGHCDLLNTNDNVCVSCDAVKPNADPKSWACSRCTYHNPVTERKCCICEMPAISDYAPIDSRSSAIRKILPVQDWKCFFCSTRNPSFTTHCDMCGRPKDRSKITTTKTEDENWESDPQKIVVCAVCTLQYNKSSSKCPVCSTKQEPARTYSGYQLISDVDVSMSVEQQRKEDEEESKKKLIKIIQFCHKYRDLFTDPSFYPGPKSLYWDGKFSGPAGEDPAKRWLRPARVGKDSDQKWKVFREKPSSSDIIQGCLGNCWFLSALAVVTEYNQLIKNIMISQEFCREGVYQVRLFIQGEWRTELIDDLLPCDAEGRLLYSQAKSKQLWVPLIEKATAKAYGCYEALVAGRCLQGLSTLTGFPCWSITLQNENSGGCETEVDKDIIWATLLSAKEQGYLMGASCGGGNMTLKEEEYKLVGLRSRHAYSVLDVEEVKTFHVDHQNSSVRLLKLRNPWGRYEWIGDWSRESELWSSVTGSSTLNRGGFQEGEFCISQLDFMRYFDSVDICKYIPNHNSETVNYEIIKNTCSSTQLNICMLTVEESTDVDLTIFPCDKPPGRKDSRDLCIIILEKGDSDDLSFKSVVKSSKRKISPFVHCDANLKPGSYFVLCCNFNRWNTDPQDCYINGRLSCFFSRRVRLGRFKSPSNDGILADALIQMVLEKHRNQECQRRSIENDLVHVYYVAKDWSGIIMMVENNLDRNISIVCDSCDSINVSTTRGNFKTEDVIPARHRQIIQILSQLEITEKFIIHHKMLHTTNADVETHDPPVSNSLAGLHKPRPIL